MRWDTRQKNSINGRKKEPTKFLSARSKCNGWLKRNYLPGSTGANVLRWTRVSKRAIKLDIAGLIFIRLPVKLVAMRFLK